MARAVVAEPVTVAPSNNVYTVLAAAGSVVVLLGLVVLFVRAGTLDIKILPF